MQEGDDLLDHVNKIKALTYQLVCLRVHVRNEDIVITLLDNLSTLYKHLITTFETIPIKELMMNYMTMHFMHKMLKRKKKKKSQGEDAAMVLRQNKGTIHFGAKVQGCVFIAPNQATLRIFVAKKSIRSAKIQKTKGQ